MFKYQEQFALQLTDNWNSGKCTEVRLTIRQLKNKAKSAYISGLITYNLAIHDIHEAACFVSFMHPDYQ